MARIPRARVEFLTTLALFRTRETVAVDTLARRATCSRFMVRLYCKLAVDRWLYKGDPGNAFSTGRPFRRSNPGPALRVTAHALEDTRHYRLRRQLEKSVRVLLDQRGDFG